MIWSDKAVLERIAALEGTIDALNRQFAEAIWLLHRLILGENLMSKDLVALQSAVAADTDATNSALTLIKGIAAQLADAQGDPAKVQTLIDQLNANAAALSSAVASNTPADPTIPAPAP